MNSVQLLDSFVTELFGEESGYVYAPVMAKGVWQQEFFRWPTDTSKLIEHLSNHKTRDVYLSPALFNRPVITLDSFKGTHYLWTEFDGALPDNPTIPPTVRIQSSKKGYEHWYWKLNKFVTDPGTITDYTRRLAYTYGADLSAWAYNKVLRPPGTTNHKRNLPVTVLENTNISYDLRTFAELPVVPRDNEVSINKSNLPQLARLIATYKWPDDAYSLLTKELKQGEVDRSAALTRLAIHCVEMGMSNDEIYVVIEHVDMKCKKFVGRTDRESRLEGLISYARSYKAVEAEITHDTSVYRFNDFMETTIKMKWVIPGLIPVAGSALIFGPPGQGKSTWAIRMGIQVATGGDSFLDWPIERQQKVLFVSLEMPQDELKSFIDDMLIPNEIRPKLQENFFVWPIGYPYPFDVREQQTEVLKYIDDFGIELIIIDSLGVAMYGSISNDDDVKRLNSFLNEDVRGARGCGYFFVHHPRKPGAAEVKHPKDMYDAFGSSYIINNAQTVINLNPSGRPGRSVVNLYKTRLSQDQQSFEVERLPNRDFRRLRTISTEDKQTEGLTTDAPGILSFGKDMSKK